MHKINIKFTFFLIFLYVSTVLILLLSSDNQKILSEIGHYSPLKVGDSATLIIGETFYKEKMKIDTTKNILLCFLKSTCPSCKSYIKKLQKSKNLIVKNNTEIIAVIADEPWIAKNFVNEMEIDFPVIIDHDLSLFKSYRIKFTMCIILVNQLNKIEYIQQFSTPFDNVLNDIIKIVGAQND